MVKEQPECTFVSLWCNLGEAWKRITAPAFLTASWTKVIFVFVFLLYLLVNYSYITLKNTIQWKTNSMNTMTIGTFCECNTVHVNIIFPFCKSSYDLLSTFGFGRSRSVIDTTLSICIISIDDGALLMSFVIVLLS